jgi:hypothetical protein
MEAVTAHRVHRAPARGCRVQVRVEDAILLIRRDSSRHWVGILPERVDHRAGGRPCRALERPPLNRLGVSVHRGNQRVLVRAGRSRAARTSPTETSRSAEADRNCRNFWAADHTADDDSRARARLIRALIARSLCRCAATVVSASLKSTCSCACAIKSRSICNISCFNSAWSVMAMYAAYLCCAGKRCLKPHNPPVKAAKHFVVPVGSSGDLLMRPGVRAFDLQLGCCADSYISTGAGQAGVGTMSSARS